MQLHRAPKCTKTYWRVENTIYLSILIIISASVYGVLSFFSVKIPDWVFIGSILVIAFLCIVTIFVTPSLRYNFFSYGVDEDKIEFHSGAFVKKETLIPMVRIQQITVSVGPISKLFQLGDLEIITANGGITLSGIPVEEARSLATKLNAIVGIKVEEENDSN